MGSDRDRKNFGSGYNHGFKPVSSIDLSKVKDFDALLQDMSKTSFGGRKLGEAADVLYDMIIDKDSFVVLTLSGAMTVAKMGLLVCDMIDQKMIQAIVSTGALITHGLVENTGMTHFKYDPDIKNDKELRNSGYDRVYDTLELEKNLDDLELIVNKIFGTFSEKDKLYSQKITNKLGEYLVQKTKGRGILKSAYINNVPVYIPAFTDSELGLDFALYNRRLKLKNRKKLSFNPFYDLEHFTELIFKQKELGIFTIGGGVPRNWAQQVGPYLDLIRFRIIEKDKYIASNENPYIRRYKYAVRICPEPVHWGGLSGCTYSEGVSWGKFYSKDEGGRHAEVLSDATIAWPILLKAVQEKLEKNKITIKKNYNNEKILQDLAI